MIHRYIRSSRQFKPCRAPYTCLSSSQLRYSRDFAQCLSIPYDAHGSTVPVTSEGIVIGLQRHLLVWTRYCRPSQRELFAAHNRLLVLRALSQATCSDIRPTSTESSLPSNHGRQSMVKTSPPTWRRWVNLLTFCWMPIPTNFTISRILAAAPEVTAKFSVPVTSISIVGASVF